MGIFSNLFGKKQSKPPSPEHAVLVYFSYGQTDLQPLFDLEDRLIEAISRAGAGEYDGNEVAADGGDGTLFMYGPDGDKLFQAVRQVLESASFMKGATAVIRYGPPQEGVREKRVELSS